VAALDEFLEHRRTQALVITGEPGLGKTTLWEAGQAAARERGVRVLTTRASSAETRLSYAALIDLLDAVDRDDLADLPAPQLRALELALLRAEPSGAPPEPRAISLGFMNALRTLSVTQPLLIAIDDVQWLDPPSEDVLGFAARRLPGESVRFLLTRRRGRPASVELALESAHLELGPLSLGVIRRLLVDRLGLILPRHLLRRLVDSTLGNPLFALELGRTLLEHGFPPVGEELPVPDAVEDLFGPRVSRLTPPVRRLLLAVALSAEPPLAELTALAGRDALEDAIDADVLVVDRDRARVSHPLLAAAARKRSRPRHRRELHLELAAVVADEELRARHLSLAAERPDEMLAEAVARAAATASARGARREAVELAEHALRLTPSGHEAWADRLLALGDYLVAAGDAQRVTELLTPQLETLPPGAVRVRACLILVGGLNKTNDDFRGWLERALTECTDDPALRATVIAEMMLNDLSIEVARIPQAEAAAREAAEATRSAGLLEDERWALFALGLARILRGRPIDDICTQFNQVSTATFEAGSSPERLAAKQMIWRGELERGRAVLTDLLAIADERGELWSYAWLRLDLCELELRSGRWDETTSMLDEWADSDRESMPWPQYERCRALLAAGRGVPADAERWATDAVERAHAVGARWDELEALRARGIAALLVHQPLQAAESLRAVWDHAEREGVEDPGAFPVAPDLVEALVDSGEIDEARGVTERLRTLAEEQGHPWGLATTKRCAGLIGLTTRLYEEQAAEALSEAVDAYALLGLRFDAARSLLALGRGQRRHRKWAAARESLERAVAAFDELGSPGWAEEARSELARVGARRPGATGELTPTEVRVVELAAEGLSNKQIAQTLVVTVNTVETHLSHAYAKLGIRSRAQLPRTERRRQ